MTSINDWLSKTTPAPPPLAPPKPPSAVDPWIGVIIFALFFGLSLVAAGYFYKYRTGQNEKTTQELRNQLRETLEREDKPVYPDPPYTLKIDASKMPPTKLPEGDAKQHGPNSNSAASKRAAESSARKRSKKMARRGGDRGGRGMGGRGGPGRGGGRGGFRGGGGRGGFRGGRGGYEGAAEDGGNNFGQYNNNNNNNVPKIGSLIVQAGKPVKGTAIVQNEDGSYPREVDLCQFYLRQGSCRHEHLCKHAHVKPLVSPTVMLPQAYINPKFSLTDEKGRIINYDEKWLTKHFCHFYERIWMIMMHFGRVRELQVADNLCPHLLGHVYVCYEDEASAANCVQQLTNKKFDGMLLMPELVPVNNFNEASCGEYDNGICARGEACNFLHLLRPPKSLIVDLLEAQDVFWETKAREAAEELQRREEQELMKAFAEPLPGTDAAARQQQQQDKKERHHHHRSDRRDDNREDRHRHHHRSDREDRGGDRHHHHHRSHRDEDDDDRRRRHHHSSRDDRDRDHHHHRSRRDETEEERRIRKERERRERKDKERGDGERDRDRDRHHRSSRHHDDSRRRKRSESPPKKTDAKGSDSLCHICGKVGHFASDCPLKMQM